MEFEYISVVRFAVIVIIGTLLMYLINEFLRRRRMINVEQDAQNLRLDLLREQVRYHHTKATQQEEKNLNAWSGTRKFRVDRIVPEATDICSFYLAPHDGKPLPAFDPGQYLTFQLDVAGHDRAVIRCYSLSDSPLERDRYRVTIKRIGPPRKEPDAPPGVSSGYFHTVLKEGDILDCKSPGGNFYLDTAEHTPIVLIGGGIGITPMLSMLKTVCMSGSKRETWLFYGVRDGAELVQPEVFRELEKAHENVHVRFCFSSPAEHEKQGEHYDHHSRVTVDLMQEVLPSMNYDYYICGPGPMMNSITEGLEAAGVEKNHVHYESFGPASVKPKTPPPTAEADSGVSFKVMFAKSNKELDWQPSSGTILDFAEANGINMDCGCRAGSCGTCTIAVREGTFDYIDEISAETEAGSCLACMAVPKDRLVIDA
ncbi:MAG: 2Fe-2S iron-sulfur cluster binding domain-containing protein [Gammaproteobacteria bacterium]|nr:2Fe-2S iron-sulfur cluster binding domain-containing protein [Gammaproteobacteria bacterium]